MPQDKKIDYSKEPPLHEVLAKLSAGDRYFLKPDTESIEIWNEVTQKAFVNAERAAGFHPKPGCGPVATGGFSGAGMVGRVVNIRHREHFPLRYIDLEHNLRDNRPGKDEKTDRPAPPKMAVLLGEHSVQFVIPADKLGDFDTDDDGTLRIVLDRSAYEEFSKAQAPVAMEILAQKAAKGADDSTKGIVLGVVSEVLKDAAKRMREGETVQGPTEALKGRVQALRAFLK